MVSVPINIPRRRVFYMTFPFTSLIREKKQVIFILGNLKVLVNLFHSSEGRAGGSRLAYWTSINLTSNTTLLSIMHMCTQPEEAAMLSA